MRARRHTLRGVPVFGLLALAAGAPACGHDPRPGASAVLITLDTTRPDALSCYGNRENTTPNLQALAADGVVFEAAHTVMGLTLPAHTSMLTGLFPLRHGLRDNGVGALPSSAETLATRAHAAGVETAAFVSSVVLDDDFGLQHGFDVYSVPERRGASERAHGAERPGEDTVDQALAWLAKRDPARRFFLWVHLYDPHHPYEPPPAFARFSTPYLGEVASMDHAIGRLLEGLRAHAAWDETFLLAVADHGEAFGEHGEVTHGSFCYETTLHVPLIARWPASMRARTPGSRSDELVSVVDVTPTILEALGVESPGGIDGLSFFAHPVSPERGVYFESYYAYLSCGWSPLAGWMDGSAKYIHSSEPELYDWRADPGELHDLAGERAGEEERFRREIARLAELPAIEPDELGDSPALVAIQSLGYASSGETGGALPHPLAETGLPSPRSQAAFFAKQAMAQEHLAAGRVAEAAAIYEAVLAESPNNFFAAEEFGTLALQLGRTEDAIAVLARLAKEGPQRGKYWLKLGLALCSAERFEEAVAPLERAVEMTNGRPAYLKALRTALTHLGREAEMEAIEKRYRKAGAKG